VIGVVVLLVLAAAGAVIGIRHLYFLLDRPGGTTCSMRVAEGACAGLGPRFHAGYAGPQMRDLLWRRLAWPGPAVTFPVTAIRLDRERPPVPSERWRVPSSFSIVPVVLDDGVVLEIALPRRRVRKVLGLIDGGPTDGPSGRGRRR